MKTHLYLADMLILCIGSMAIADSHVEVDPAVTARQAHM